MAPGIACMTPTTRVYRTSLRSRIILALGLIVTVTAGLFAFGVLRMKEQLEVVIFDDMVQEQLQALLLQVDTKTYDTDKLFKDWTFYFADTLASAPAALLALPPGSHHSIQIDGRHYQVEVDEHDSGKVILTYDITDWERQERTLLEGLAWSIVALLLAALLMGWQAARAILAPVRALTGRLTTIEPRQRQVRIAQEFQGYEIGQIARAFDQYMERLDKFVERERSFTAAASHELRTPLSVMIGALDVLDTQTQSPAAQRALARLHRACGEMRAFIEATLFLSREDGNTIQEQHRAPLAQIVRGLGEDNHPLLAARNIALTIRIADHYQPQQPASIVQIMIGNILRNAIEHTRDGSITISLDGDQLTLRDSGNGIAPEHLPRVCDYSFTTKPDGSGLGLNLVRRICDRYGWELRLESKLNSGTAVTIDFGNQPGGR